MELSQNTLNELNTLIQCDGPAAEKCANCICGDKLEEEYRFVCQYEYIIGKFLVKARETFGKDNKYD